MIILNIDEFNFNNCDQKINIAHKNGVKDIVFISEKTKEDKKRNIYNKFENIKYKYKDLEINLYLASIVKYDDKLFKYIDENEIITINDGKYCFITFPINEEVDIDEVLYHLRLKGLKPILINPERYLSYDKIIQYYENCYISIDSESLFGKNGHKSKKLANKLLKENKVEQIITNVRDEEDIIKYKRLKKLINRKYGYEVSNEIFDENTMKILKNKSTF